MEQIGFLKLAQEFRSNVKYEEYFPILDRLEDIASDYQNNLPASFFIHNAYQFEAKKVELVLSKLYPMRNYHCSKVETGIFCIK